MVATLDQDRMNKLAFIQPIKALSDFFHLLGTGTGTGGISPVSIFPFMKVFLVFLISFFFSVLVVPWYSQGCTK